RFLPLLALWLAAASLLAAQVSAERQRLEQSLTQSATGPQFLLLTLGVAFFLGAAHGLTPGHGKTIVAAYLVGSRGTLWDAVYLGSVVTLTHTSSVFVLGFFTLFASRYVLMDRIYPWLSVLSGVLVVAMGIWLLRVRWRAPGRQDHHHGHDHHHPHDHPHPHPHSHPHDHAHDHAPAVSRWQLLSLGVSGGLVPCPEALVVLLMAVSLHKLGFGLVILVAFSVGLAAVLISIGVAMILAGPLMSRLSPSGWMTRALPIGSAAVVTILGCGIVYKALLDSRLLRF
ncbi:MAG TPA: hypothetical protein VEU62_00685, partial [Bryobacterales bacterium]|nr:hypothetical protein [Bryobacterales bacterium]